VNKQFAIGLASGLLLFLIINLLAIHLNSDCGLATLSPGSSCADGIAQVGWPMQFYESGGFMYQQNFNLVFLLIDLAFGVAVGLLLGWIFSRRKKALPK
jgi:ABC-type antimicrobial peptide transport system permease subunit